MDTKTVSTFLAVLALLCLVGTIGALAFVAAARRAPAGSGLALWRDDIRGVSLWLGFVVAASAMAGSLWLSEVANFTPCPLCWYQRICMYPLALILGIAAVRRDVSVRVYVMALAGVGVVIASYHSWIQAFPPSNGTSFCTIDAPCTERYVWEFGFVSIPFMALCGFAFIIVMMIAAGGGIASRPDDA
jgi:disulfide bond formation protein DsbB